MTIQEKKVTNYQIIKPFDCGDDDLNEFLFEKAEQYQKELLATTFVIEDEIHTLAYYSLFNDSFRIEDISFQSKNAIKTFLRQIVSHPKRHLKHYPAIKIGRLAISNQIQKSGFGKKIIENIISLAIKQNERCACKFILVDAYKNALGFYEKMRFEYFSDKDKYDETRQMYLDITPYLNAKTQPS